MKVLSILLASLTFFLAGCEPALRSRDALEAEVRQYYFRDSKLSSLIVESRTWDWAVENKMLVSKSKLLELKLNVDPSDILWLVLAEGKINPRNFCNSGLPIQKATLLLSADQKHIVYSLCKPVSSD